MASTTFLQQAYLAYFGRPADVSGMLYYSNKTEFEVVSAFSRSPESQAFFGSMTILNQVNAIYQNLFNRPAETAGLLYWAQEIELGHLTLASAAMGILNGAQNDDKLAVTNKLAASAAFTAALDTNEEITGYAGAASITPARAYLHAVDHTAASLTAATAGLDASVTSVVTASTAVSGQTFTLTTGANTFTGTSGNDEFIAGDVAGAASWTTADKLDGGLGADTFTVNAAAAITVPVLATVTNIETASLISAAGVTATTTSWTGLTSLGVTAADDVTVTASATTDVTIAASALSEAASSTELSVNGGNNVTVTSADTVQAEDAASAVSSIVIGGTTAASGNVTVTHTETVSDDDTSTAADAATTSAITVTGGKNITVTSKVVVGASDHASDLATIGTVTVTGDANTTAVTVIETSRAARATTAIGIANGIVTIADGNAVTASDTITDVTLNYFGNSTIASNVLSTVNLKGGSASTTTSGTLGLNTTTTDTSTVAKTLNLNLAGGYVGAVTGTQADKYTTVNVSTSAASNVADVVFAAATTLNFSGAAVATLGASVGDGLNASTNAVLATINSTGAGVTINEALDTDVTFNGGDGVETITVGATTKAIVMGAGNDSVTLSGSALGTAGTIDAGAGDADVLGLTAADAVTASATGTLEAVVSGFERLSVAAMSADSAINLANLDDINYVTSAGGSQTMTISGATSGFTLVQTAAATAHTVNLVDTTGTADSVSMKITAAATVAAGTLTANGVESISVESDDTTTPDRSVDHTLTVSSGAVKTLTFSGDASLTLTNTSTTLTSVNASAMTDDLLWATVGAIAANATITGGAGNDNIGGTGNTSAKNLYIDGGAGIDTLRGGDGNDTIIDTSSTGNSIIGGSGNDTITGGEGNDDIDGGTGIDSIVAGGGADTLTGGGGNDYISAGDGNDSIVGASGSENIDAGAGDDTLVMAANWTTGDTIVGGDGNDTLTVTASAALTTAGTTSGVEVVTATFDGGDDVLAMAAVTGVVTLNLAASSAGYASITGLNSGATVVNASANVDLVSIDTAAGASVTYYANNDQTTGSGSTTFSDAVSVTITNSGTTAGATDNVVLDTVDTTSLTIAAGNAADLVVTAITGTNALTSASLTAQTAGQDLTVTSIADADALTSLTLSAVGGAITVSGAIGADSTTDGNAEVLATINLTATNGGSAGLYQVWADDTTDGTSTDSAAADNAMTINASATATSTVAIGTVDNYRGTIALNATGGGTVGSTSLIADDITVVVSAAGTHAALTATDDITITATNTGDVTFTSLDSGSTSTGAITATASGSGIFRIADVVATAGTVSVDGQSATGAVRVFAESVTGSTTLTGGSAADSLTGGSGNDLITGNAGNDTITSGAGADTLAGGAGNDTYVMSTGWTTTDVITDSDGAADVLSATLTSALTPAALAGIETLTLVMNGASVNATNITGTTTLNISGTTNGTAAFTNLTNEVATVNQTSDLGAVSIGFVTGAAATVKYDLGATTAAQTNASTAFVNVKTLTIEGSDDASENADLTSLAAATATDITVKAMSSSTVDTGTVSAAKLVNLTLSTASTGQLETGTVTAGADLKTVSVTGTTGQIVIGAITATGAALDSYTVTAGASTGTNTFGAITATSVGAINVTAGNGGGTYAFADLRDITGSIGSITIDADDNVTFTNGPSAATSVGAITATSISGATIDLGTVGATGATIGDITHTGGGTFTFVAGDAVSVGAVTGGAGATNVTLNNNILVGTTMTGGAGADAFKGTGANDVITAGSGADSITGNGGSDTITLSDDSAVDYVFFAAATDGGSTGDTVTGFVVGSDLINITGALKTALDSDTSKVTGDVTANTAAGATYALETTAIGFVNAANNGTLTVADLSASTLTAVAVSINASFNQADAGGDSDLQTEIFLVESDTVGTFGLYAWTQSAADDVTITAAELKLLGVFTTNGAVAITATEIAIA